METIEQLKKNPDYLFKCNITANDYKIMTSCDVWDAAYIRCGSKGVEYNFCMDNGCNYSAIYMSEETHDGKYFMTDSSRYECYEIDFEDMEWKKKLEEQICRIFQKFHG